ncbi:SDR family oxidoreductase [Streptomyces anulatus]|uniref:NAD-dependent epimerase/dehydratase family protein n=1 Tax=Streptomyces anulatus TaxID=1892 RepID=UPI0033F1D4D5
MTRGLRVLVTGCQGYVGSVLVPELTRRGHEVTGVDIGYFRTPEARQPEGGPRSVDIRDLERADLAGVDAVIHLAAISNDPMSHSHVEATRQINHEATVRLAQLSRTAGVNRFVFASTCSVYGASATSLEVDEQGLTDPLTPYAETKLLAERQLVDLAEDDCFTPVVLRFATAYGPSPMLRTDIVVNSLVAQGLSTGQVRLESAGLAWRPLIHVRDMARTAIAVLEAPADQVRGETFNAGPPGGNYQVIDIARAVAAAIPGAEVSRPEGAQVDNRTYRVGFAKLETHFPDLTAGMYRLEAGVKDTVAALTHDRLAHGDQWLTSRFVRLARLRELVDGGRLTADLRIP